VDSSDKLLFLIGLCLVLNALVSMLIFVHFAIEILAVKKLIDF